VQLATYVLLGTRSKQKWRKLGSVMNCIHLVHSIQSWSHLVKQGHAVLASSMAIRARSSIIAISEDDASPPLHLQRPLWQPWSSTTTPNHWIVWLQNIHIIKRSFKIGTKITWILSNNATWLMKCFGHYANYLLWEKNQFKILNPMGRWNCYLIRKV
jgi:hypothetical protein